MRHIFLQLSVELVGQFDLFTLSLSQFAVKLTRVGVILGQIHLVNLLLGGLWKNADQLRVGLFQTLAVLLSEEVHDGLSAIWGNFFSLLLLLLLTLLRLVLPIVVLWELSGVERVLLERRALGYLCHMPDQSGLLNFDIRGGVLV